MGIDLFADSSSEIKPPAAAVANTAARRNLTAAPAAHPGELES